MTEQFESRAHDIAAPARRGFAITANDAADLVAETRAVYVGGAGDLSLILSSGDAVTLAGVTGGSVLPLRISRVKATGTSATQLVGLY